MPFVDCFPLRRLDRSLHRKTHDPASFLWFFFSSQLRCSASWVTCDPVKSSAFVMCQRRRASGQVSCSEGYASHVCGFRSLIGHVRRGSGTILLARDEFSWAPLWDRDVASINYDYRF